MPNGHRTPTIVVYTRAFCIWCWRVKRLLHKNRVEFEERDARSAEVRAWLVQRTGRTTVPQVLVDDVPIGGFEDTCAWIESGGLRLIGRAG